ncbi:MAG: DUF3467 domain-containing protein [Candidatus Aenigmatarchaeota archaeon]
MQGKRKINVNIDHTEPAFFSDYLVVSHSPNKFILDFVQVTPRFDKIGDDMQQSLVMKHKTIMVDPPVAKNIMETLKDNIEKYEKNFGKIKYEKIKTKGKEAEFVDENTRYIG